MPDPTAHADDMKSPAKHETMPSLWWLEPFGFAVSQWNARAEFYKYWRNSIADHNTFQRKVELTLKPVFGDCGYEDTIDLVDWAAEEIKDLRSDKARCKAELLETKETVLKLVAGNERAGDDMTKAEARIKQLTMFCERAGAERDREKQRVEEITLMVNIRDKEIIRLTNLTRSLKRRLSKAEKAAGTKPAKKKGARRA